MNDTLVRLKLAVQAAWEAMASMPDVDARFRKGAQGCWPTTATEWTDELAQAELTEGERRDRQATANRVVTRATPQQISHMEIVMQWMAWLRRQPRKDGGGDAALKRIISWSMGASYQAIAWRERCSKNTIPYRLNKSLAAIVWEFQLTPTFAIVLNSVPQSDVLAEVEPSEPPRHGLAFAPPRGTSESGTVLRQGKAFISGRNG